MNNLNNRRGIVSTPFTFRAFILLIFLLLYFPVSAQKNNFIDMRGGVERLAIRDKGMSPLMYTGLGFFGGVDWHRLGTNQTIQLGLNASMGKQRNKYGYPVDYRKASIQLSTFYHKNKSREGKLLWGWTLNNLIAHRYNAGMVNFQDHFEYFTNIGPAAKYRYPIKIKERELNLELLGHIQLLGFMIRPSYTSSYPTGFLQEEEKVVQGLWKSAELFYPGNSWNFGFHPKLNYVLKSGNKISVGYRYEFYRLNSRITHSGGAWFFSLITWI